MLTLRTEPRRLLPTMGHSRGTGFAGHELFEASSIRKIRGKYYLVYSSIACHELCYAVSDRPDRGFRYGGVVVSNCDLFPGEKPATPSATTTAGWNASTGSTTSSITAPPTAACIPGRAAPSGWRSGRTAAFPVWRDQLRAQRRTAGSQRQLPGYHLLPPVRQADPHLLRQDADGQQTSLHHPGRSRLVAGGCRTAAAAVHCQRAGRHDPPCTDISTVRAPPASRLRCGAEPGAGCWSG